MRFMPELSRGRLIASLLVTFLSILNKLYIVVLASRVLKGRWDLSPKIDSNCVGCEKEENEKAACQLCGMFMLILFEVCKLGTKAV